MLAAAPQPADLQRPQFHVLPLKNWMNDPNGPVFFNVSFSRFWRPA